ncbi:pectate lyase family protein [Palleronia marisminoris]|uniref:pectate lyase family protein n=1 Tax=Palleronia marisminoris TaxID=315423 RepID=UPI001587A5AF|nr:hypothetical protein [Palleronia marisminoris]
MSLLAALVLSATPAVLWAEAFPGAVGYGRGATGWQGGAIIPVTTLANAGRGSFRACAERDIPRICLIHVSGTVILSGPVMVRSNGYIAGQTAPGDGLQLRLNGYGATPLVIKNAHDVLVRFLKIRPGPTIRPNPAVDAVTIENAQRVYLDHLSLSFATDETFNVHASRGETADITLARSLLSFSLDRSSHPKGRHSKGALLCSYDATATGCGRITLWQNVFAHHRDRNPDVKASSTGPVEVVNNVFFNPISQFGEYYNLVGPTHIIHVGNVTIPGPSTNSDRPPAVEIFPLGGAIPISILPGDNIAYRGPCMTNSGAAVLGPVAQSKVVAAPGLIPATPAEPAKGLVDRLLPIVGDSLHPDALDKRAVADIVECRGRVINAPSQVGGWPDLRPRAAARDRDGDKFPDNWEAGQASLSVDRPDDPWSPHPSTGMPQITTWLSWLAGDISDPR